MTIEPDPPQRPARSDRPLWGPPRHPLAAELPPAPPAAEPAPVVAPPEYAPPEPARSQYASSPPPPPLPQPTPRPRPAPVVFAGAAVVLALLAGGVVWASLRSHGPTPDVATTTAAGAPAATAAAPADTVQQTTPAASVSASGLVRLDAAVLDPAASAVLALLDRHFGAINARDYAAWSTTVVPQRVAHQPMSTWMTAYRSTQDQDVEVSAVTATGSDSVDVALTFMSTQDPADAPADLQVSRICWRSTWPVVDLGSGGRIGTPSRGATSDWAC